MSTRSRNIRSITAHLVTKAARIAGVAALGLVGLGAAGCGDPPFVGPFPDLGLPQDQVVVPVDTLVVTDPVPPIDQPDQPGPTDGPGPSDLTPADVPGTPDGGPDGGKPIPPWTFGSYGDQGTGNNARQVSALGASFEPELWVHAGDLSYQTTQAGDERWWNETVAPIRAKVADRYLIALGNHDEPNRDWFLSTVRDPIAGAEVFSGESGWWSYDYKNAHFVFAATSSGTADPPAAAVTWVRDDIRAARSRGVDWVFFVMHPPCYCTENRIGSSHGDSTAVCNPLEPVLATEGVDVVLTGHAHSYHRTFPMVYVPGHTGVMPKTLEQTTYTAEDIAGAPIYLVLGTAGIELRTPDNLSPSYRLDAFVAAFGDSGGSVRSDGGDIIQIPQQYGAGKFTIDGRKLSYELVQLGGATVDSFTIQK